MAPVSLWHHKQKALAAGHAKTDAPSLAKEPLWTQAFSRIWIMNLVLCGWAFMINATFPFYIKHLGGTELLVGITGAGFALACLIMRPAAGWVLDHKSRSGLLKGGVAALIVISILYLITPVLSLVVVLRLVSGFVFSGVSTASNTNACDIIPQSRFGEGIGFLGLGNTLATALGPALGLLIMARLGFPILYGISICLVLLAVLVARGLDYKTVKPQPYLRGRYRLKFADLFNTDALPASVVTLFAAAPYGGVSAFIALYGEFSSLGQGGIFFMLVAVGTGSTRLFAGRLADKKGESLLVAIGNICFMVGLFLLVLQSSSCYYVSGLFFGWGFGCSTPAMQTMAVRIVPLERRGSASSTFLCAYDVGAGLGALTAGWLVTVWGYREMFASLSIYIIISTLVYIMWASKTPSAFKVYMRSKARLQGAAHESA